MKQRRAVLTRIQILDAAAARFDTYGYAATGISDIVADAHTTKGALYFHFPSKETLAQQLIASWSADVVAAYESATNTTTPAIHQLLMVFRALAHRVATVPTVRAGAKLTTDRSIDGAPRAHQRWVDATLILVEGAIAADEIEERSAHLFAWNLCAHFVGALQMRDNAREMGIEFETIIDDAVASFLAGVLTPLDRLDSPTILTAQLPSIGPCWNADNTCDPHEDSALP